MHCVKCLRALPKKAATVRRQRPPTFFLQTTLPPPSVAIMFADRLPAKVSYGNNFPTGVSSTKHIPSFLSRSSVCRPPPHQGFFRNQIANQPSPPKGHTGWDDAPTQRNSLAGGVPRDNEANHNTISTLRFAAACSPWFFLRFCAPNERIVKLKSSKEERLSNTFPTTPTLRFVALVIKNL